jgi:hypothetical protein
MYSFSGNICWVLQVKKKKKRKNPEECGGPQLE